MMENPYIPHQAVIDRIKQETTGDRAIKTLDVKLQNNASDKSFQFHPGQCAMLGILGVGESMISIASAPSQNDILTFSIMKLGRVTSEIHACEEGDLLTIRGPYGNYFPLSDWKNKNIVTVGGGIGQAPLRSVIRYVLDKRNDYGDVDIIYGARSVSDLCYRDEFEKLEKGNKVYVHLSIDEEEEGWKQFVGFVPDNLLRIKPSPNNTIVITCGPPIMITLVIKKLIGLGFQDTQIYTTLEKRMKCGIGKCGRCNVGSLYVCKDGPVFSYQQLKTLPET